MLSGWGAGLDIKRVDYLTIDDRDITGQGQGGDRYVAEEKAKSAHESHTGHNLFDEEDRQSNEMVQLKGSQLEGGLKILTVYSSIRVTLTKCNFASLDIGLRAIQLILAHPRTALNTLKRLSQDFPKYAHRLVTSWIPSINESIREEIEAVQRRFVEGGRNVMWLNGLLLREQDFRPFRLVTKDFCNVFYF